MIPIKVPNLPNVKLLKRIIPLVIPLVIIIVTYTLPQNDFKSTIAFVFLIFVFSIYRFDSRILIAYGVILLIFTAILTYSNVINAAEHIAVLSYLTISSGIVSLIIDFYRKRTVIQHTG